MKTFESQLLELLREFREFENKEYRRDNEPYGLEEWLLMRQEESKTKKERLIALCDSYSQSGFLDNIGDDKEEFINAILDL